MAEAGHEVELKAEEKERKKRKTADLGRRIWPQMKSVMVANTRFVENKCESAFQFSLC